MLCKSSHSLLETSHNCPSYLTLSEVHARFENALGNKSSFHHHDQQVELGDCILTEGSGTFTIDDVPIKQLMRVVEIFMTTAGQRRIRGQWFYQQIDTAMACKEKQTGKLFMPIPVGTIDERRLWLATVEDSETYDHIFSLDCIDKWVPTCSWCL